MPTLKYILKDKVLLLVGLIQVAIFIIMMLIFVKNIPWVMSQEISELNMYEAYSGKPPDWAKAFSVNHGSYHFYEDSTSSNKQRYYLVIGSFIFCWVSISVAGIYTKNRIKTKHENAT